MLAIYCVILGCTDQKVNTPIQSLSNDYQKLLKDSIPSCIKEIESMSWYKYNRAFIHEDNPEFRIKTADSLHYFIVPSLNIPIDQLTDFQSNILNYLDRGKL